MIKKRWIFFFVALLILCGLGLIDSEIGAGGFWGLDPKVDAANVAWMITATIFVLMMTPGLSFFYGGMVRAKNVISTMLQSFIAMGIVSVLWVFVGFSLAFGDDIGHLIGNLFHVQWSGWTCQRDVGSNIATRLIRSVPDEIRHHHPITDHRLIC